MEGTDFHTARTKGIKPCSRRGEVRANAEKVCLSAAASQHITTDVAT